MTKRLTNPQPRSLLLLIPAAGLVGLTLRLMMNVSGIDDKGLLVSGHPTWILLLALSAITFLLLTARTIGIRGPASCRGSFPRSPLAAAGYVLAALSAVSGAVAHWQSVPAQPAAHYLTGTVLTLASIAFALAALCRLKERRPNFLLHVVICIYFALETLALYQTWSFDPQIQDYCFQLLACIALTMTAYQLACFDTGKGSHRGLWFWGLAAVYLCCVSAASGLFFITGGVWAWTNLSNLRRPRKPAARDAEE